MAAANGGDLVHRLDPHHVFRHLVAELPLDAQPERRAVRNRQRLIVHLVGEDGLRVEGVNQRDRLVISVLLVAGIEQIVGAIEHDVARVRLELGLVQQRA